jgi:hypothetical protein
MPGELKRPWKNDSDEPRLIDTLRIPIDQAIELAVLAVKRVGIRCKLLPSQEPVTYRMVRDEVEGEIITGEAIEGLAI